MLRPFVQMPPAWAGTVAIEPPVALGSLASSAVPDYQPDTPELPAETSNADSLGQAVDQHEIANATKKHYVPSFVDDCARIVERQCMDECSPIITSCKLFKREQDSSSCQSILQPVLSERSGRAIHFAEASMTC